MTVQRKKYLCLLATVLAVAAGAFLYGSIDPASSPYFPRCLFKSLTGLECPGCGSQRAVHALLCGRISDAWSYNALLVAAIPLTLVLLAAEYLRLFHPGIPGRNTVAGRILARLDGSFAGRLAATITILWWIGRNIF